MLVTTKGGTEQGGEMHRDETIDSAPCIYAPCLHFFGAKPQPLQKQKTNKQLINIETTTALNLVQKLQNLCSTWRN